MSFTGTRILRPACFTGIEGPALYVLCTGQALLFSTFSTSFLLLGYQEERRKRNPCRTPVCRRRAGMKQPRKEGAPAASGRWNGRKVQTRPPEAGQTARTLGTQKEAAPNIVRTVNVWSTRLRVPERTSMYSQAVATVPSRFFYESVYKLRLLIFYLTR